MELAQPLWNVSKKQLQKNERREKTQHASQRHHCNRRHVQSGAGARAGSAFQLAFRNSGHGPVSDRVPSSESSSRSLCRGSALHRVRNSFFSKDRKRRAVRRMGFGLEDAHAGHSLHERD